MKIFPVGCCGCEAGPTLASVIVVSSRFSEPPPRNALPENSLELLTITTYTQCRNPKTELCWDLTCRTRTSPSYTDARRTICRRTSGWCRRCPFEEDTWRLPNLCSARVVTSIVTDTIIQGARDQKTKLDRTTLLTITLLTSSSSSPAAVRRRNSPESHDTNFDLFPVLRRSRWGVTTPPTLTPPPVAPPPAAVSSREDSGDWCSWPPFPGIPAGLRSASVSVSILPELGSSAWSLVKPSWPGLGVGGPDGHLSATDRILPLHRALSRASRIFGLTQVFTALTEYTFSILVSLSTQTTVLKPPRK